MSKVIKQIKEKMEAGGVVVEKTRTIPQNDSLHLWFRLVAEVLKGDGVTMTRLLKDLATKGIEVYPTEHGIKYAWKQLQKKQYGTKSTTELKKTGEIDDLIDAFIKFCGQEYGSAIPPLPFKCKACGGLGKHKKDCPEI